MGNIACLGYNSLNEIMINLKYKIYFFFWLKVVAIAFDMNLCGFILNYNLKKIFAPSSYFYSVREIISN